MTTWSSRTLWVAGAACLFWFVGAPNWSMSQGPSTLPQGELSGGQVQMISTTLPNGGQQLVVLDAAARTMAVYHVDNGNLQLRSVRNVTWDLRMEEFNGVPPLPSELRRVRN